MSSSFGNLGSFSIPIDNKGTKRDIKIAPSQTAAAENLSLITWGASYILASQLHKLDLPKRSDGKRQTILELGAGTGVVGLLAAMLAPSHLILTDLAPIVPSLAANIDLNAEGLKAANSTASAGTLDWASPQAIQIPKSAANPQEDLTIIPKDEDKPTVLLLADTIYSSDHPELLLSAIATWLSPKPEARVVVCYALRWAYIDYIREFWDGLEAMGLACLREGREKVDEGWGEVGGAEVEWCVWAWKDEARE